MTLYCVKYFSFQVRAAATSTQAATSSSRSSTPAAAATPQSAASTSATPPATPTSRRYFEHPAWTSVTEFGKDDMVKCKVADAKMPEEVEMQYTDDWVAQLKRRYGLNNMQYHEVETIKQLQEDIRLHCTTVSTFGITACLYNFMVNFHGYSSFLGLFPLRLISCSIFGICNLWAMRLLLHFQGIEYEQSLDKLRSLHEVRLREGLADAKEIKERETELQGFTRHLAQYLDERNRLMKDLKTIVYEANKNLKVGLQFTLPITKWKNGA